MKIGVFGNCQVVGMAASISAMLPEAEVHRFGLPTAKLSDAATLAAQLEIFASCDHVFLQPSAQHNFPSLQMQDFESRCRSIVAYPLIASRASHPDCDYLLAQDGSIVEGPIGHYQSAIAAGAYLAGLPVERAVGLYNQFTYRKLGFFNHDNATEVVGVEASRLNYDLVAFLTGKAGPFMHSINHPMINIVFEIARQGLQKIGIETDSTTPPPPDDLARHAVWPIYPGLPGKAADDDSFAFKFADRGVNMNLPDYVDASYQAFHLSNGDFDSALCRKMREFIAEHVK